MLLWIDESTVTAPDPNLSWDVPGGYRHADGWLLWAEDRGAGPGRFGMGPVRYDKRRGGRLWTLSWEQRGLSFDHEAGMVMGIAHVSGFLNSDWSVREMTSSGEINEFALFEQMLPRLAEYTERFVPTLSAARRRDLELRRTAAEVDPQGFGRWRYA